MQNNTAVARRRILKAAVAALTVSRVPLSFAADPLKIGLIVPLTGPFASTGRQIEAAMRLYMQRNGDTVAGRKVELIVKDDAGLAPETTKRIAQEMVVTRQGERARRLRPDAARLRHGADRDRGEGADDRDGGRDVGHPASSPFIVRSGFTLPQITAPIADWAAKSKIKRVVHARHRLRARASTREKTFVKRFTEAGGKVVESLRTPLRNPDYAPFLQRTKDAKPDAAVRVRAVGRRHRR